jgi:hypothetical protein
MVMLVSLVLACRSRPRITDRGYEGTWQRGNDRVRSTISILKRGDRYLFRWSQTTKDESWLVRCGWDGRCVETVDGKKVSDYVFRTWIDEKTGRLMVESSRTGSATSKVDVHDVDQLEVEAGGTTLVCHTVERNGQRYPVGGGPARWFSKIADKVFDPP